jgi:predicted nuclease of predicted toxin-antitoxin system
VSLRSAHRDMSVMKFLIDEDISPTAARYLCQELLIDAVAVRDRGLLGVDDRRILEYAFNEDRILVTANIKDFERFARASEIHAGIVFIQEGDLLRDEQIAVLQEAIQAIQAELEAGNDLVNRVLYISIDGTKKFETLP